MGDATLEVFAGDTLIFASRGRWLHPLLELEEFLARRPVREMLRARDRIVGKAAALLMVRLGIRSVEAGVMSRLAERVLRAHGIPYRYDSLVERIDCRTEQLLAEVDDPNEAHGIIAARAAAAINRSD